MYIIHRTVQYLLSKLNNAHIAYVIQLDYLYALYVHIIYSFIQLLYHVSLSKRKSWYTNWFCLKGQSQEKYGVFSYEVLL